MAQVAYTPNLRLKLSSDLSADARYNLGVIDYLGGKLTIGTSGDTKLRSSSHIVIEPDSPEIAGGSGSGVGNLSLGTGSNPLANLNIYATNLTFNGTVLSGYALGEYNVVVGNSSDVATTVDTSAVGDILVSSIDGLKIKDGTIGEAQISSLPISKIELLQESLNLKSDITYVDSELALRDADIITVQNNITAHEQASPAHAASAITSSAYRNLPDGDVQGSLEWLYELFDATIAYQVDGGEPDSVYGGTTPVDGGEI
jgi:hypothetical protein